jgi:outer membrane protein insertion porin family
MSTSYKQKFSNSVLAATGFAIASLATLVVMPVAQAQQQGPAPQVQGGAVVQQVLVRGNQRIEADTIRSYLIIRPGQRVDQQSLDTALKTLFATGLFKDVDISLTGNALVVQVVENPIVNRIIFEGNRRTKEDKLTEELQLAPRAVYTKAKVQSDLQRIIEVYRRSGRFAATVTPKVVELPQNRIDVIYEIDEGPITGVAKINFTGNEAFTSRELRDVVLTAESRFWNFFESNDNYDPDRLEYDRELLRQHYTKLGYADFQVTSAIAELSPDRKNFFISFDVDEGPKYDFGKVRVRTNLDRVNSDYLERILPIRTGQQFNSELIEKATESITYATGVSGYAFVDVNPRLARNPEARTVDITFEVNEGPRVYVERINIGGNTTTLDNVIRREMRLAEGDAFNRVLVDRSQRRINSLGFFSDVTIEELPGTAPDRTVLDVKVAEQSTGSFSVGAGVSSADNFIANMSIQQSNLLGRGQFLQLDLRASSRQESVNIRFREPYFLGRNLSAGFDIFGSSLDFEESGFVRESIGAGLSVGFPVSENGRLGLNYILRNDDVLIDSRSSFTVATDTPTSTVVISNPQGTVDRVSNPGDPNSDVITAQTCDFIINQLESTCESRGESLTSALGYSLSFNQLDNPFLPTRGWRASLSQTFAGLGGDVQYLKSQFQAAYYRPLPFDIIGSLQMDVGYVDGWGDDTIRISDRFFRGASSFRGFEVAGVGPRRVREDGSNRNTRSSSLGGKAYAVGTVEALLPLPLPEDYGIRASLFTDFGTVGLIDEASKQLNDDTPFINPDGTISRGSWVDFNGDGILDEPIQDDLSLRATAGISINWRSPFGPVQIDISEAFIKEDYDVVEGFRFSAGRQF